MTPGRFPSLSVSAFPSVTLSHFHAKGRIPVTGMHGAGTPDVPFTFLFSESRSKLPIALSDGPDAVVKLNTSTAGASV
jgi:hypothetical protein